MVVFQVLYAIVQSSNRLALETYQILRRPLLEALRLSDPASFAVEIDEMQLLGGIKTAEYLDSEAIKA